MSAIQFSDVSKKIGPLTIIDRFDLQIPDGSFVSLLGPSGCGKTTCLRLLAGLEQNTGGQISVGGLIYSDAEKKFFVPPEKRGLGMVFQSYAVWPHLNVFENVAFPLRMAHIVQDEIKKRVDEILEIVEMSHLKNREPHELSGGQQQRVALARGLVMKPKALLLDEPLSNLDTKLREKMRVDIKALQKKLNLTMVYVTHDQLEARTMSDLIVVMNQGRLVQAGAVDELVRNPLNEFVADFLK